jgi:integrase
VIGKFPVMTLDGARAEAKRSLGETDKDGNPVSAVTKKVNTFGDFMREHYEPWVTAERKAGVQTVQAIKAQFDELYSKPLNKISPWDIEKFKATRLKAGTHPATVNRDLGRIKAALAKAIEWDLLDAHPLTKVKPAKSADEGRMQFLSDRDEKALRKALEAREKKAGRMGDHLMPMTLLALNTDMRRGELTSITWNDVNLQTKTITIRAGCAKSAKARHTPLITEAMQVLKTYKKQSDIDGRLFNVVSVKKSWGALATAAGLSTFRFHDLRHPFASKLVMAGVDLNTVRELLGHADIRMTLRSSHLAPEHKAAAVEKLVR